ncbi:MAG: GDP-mannose 4,6-dehydratase, partial [bacterium]
VYGSIPEGILSTEDYKITPNNPYSASKAAADLLVMAYVKTFGYPAMITRSSNNYGPYQFPEKVIPLMIINALSGKDLPVYGDGSNIRDWIYVEDNCCAIDEVLHKGKTGEIYNIAGGNEVKNIDLVRAILNGMSKGEQLIKYVKDRPGHDKRYAMDCAKAKKEFSWQPRTSFEQGIKKTISWYQANEAWWQDILKGEYKNYYKKLYSNR